MSEFYLSHMLARHVSDLTGPSSGAFYELYVQIWYVVIRVILDTSSRYEFGYKNQSVYDISDTSRCLFSYKYKTHTYSVVRAYHY